MDMDDTLNQEAQEKLDELRGHYYLGGIATKEEINEAIKRVKEHMRSLTAKDFLSADKYWENELELDENCFKTAKRRING